MHGEILTGLRLGAIVLWAWYGLRVLLDSYRITRQSEAVRDQGWSLYRPSEIVMAAIVVFLFSPADILIANGLIGQEDRELLNVGGVIGLHICAILKHLALDVAETGGAQGLLTAVKETAVEVA